MATAEILTPGAVEPGWYEGMPMEQYLAIPAMSASGLEDFRRSPAHFIHAKRNPKAATAAMLEGTALHLALLEPEKFEGRYVVLGGCEATKKGDGQPCTKQGSVLRDGSSYCGTHDPLKGEPMEAGIEVISEDALDRIEGMRRAVLAHPDAAQFFRGKGRSEVTGVWRDEKTGVLCKIRLDRDIERAFIHADVKTCQDASRDAFTRQVGRMGYHRKCAWYRRGMAALDRPATGSVLIAVESPRPHGCATYLMDEGDLKLVGRQIDGLLEDYAACLETNVWPGYEAGLKALKVKPWDLPEPPPALADDYDDFDDEDEGEPWH